MGEQTILLVEDEIIIRFAVGEALREAGYRVVEAGDGTEGLTILNSGQAIDLLVTDVRMPGNIDGIELMLRSKSQDPGRPVIICSGHLPAGDAVSADAFLAKPYPLDMLVASVKRLIGNPWQTNSQPRSA